MAMQANDTAEEGQNLVDKPENAWDFECEKKKKSQMVLGKNLLSVAGSYSEVISSDVYSAFCESQCYLPICSIVLSA